MITPLLPFLSLSQMSYHPPPAYVQMNCEMDRITTTFFSLSNAITFSSCICTNALEDGSCHCHFLLSRWLFGVTWWVFITWTSVWISVSVVLFMLSQACCGLNEETVDFLKKLLCLWSASNIMSWVSQLLLEMWQKLRTHILSNGLLEFGHVIVYLFIPSFRSSWS